MNARLLLNSVPSGISCRLLVLVKRIRLCKMRLTMVTEQQTDHTAEVVVIPGPDARAMSYYRSGNALWVGDAALGLLIPAVFLYTGFSARLRNRARSIGRNWFFTIVLYILVALVIDQLIRLPLDYYRGFVRPHAYGLSDQVFSKWIGDWAKSLLLTIIVSSFVLWIPYRLLKKSPQRWWLYTGLLAVPFMFFTMLVTPVWIDPLFNKYGPMKDRPLETRILALAGRAGIEGGRVYEVNKSVDTKTLNAYVTGFLGSKRIVLWDTLLAKLEPDQVLFVMGHEMGHYALHHIPKTILLSPLLILVNLYIIHLVAGRLISRNRLRWGFNQLDDIASLPLLALLAGLFALGSTPLSLAYSRYLEREADRFGLELTRNNHAAATAFVNLQASNLSNPSPGPLYMLWRASHPSLAERITFCNDYHPWLKPPPPQSN